MDEFVTAAIVGALIVSAAPRAFRRCADRDGRTVTDEVGREVKVPAEVKRIVTLAPNLTETIYALGLEDRLVGDTNFCDTPPAAKSKPHVGNPQNPSLEAIVALASRPGAGDDVDQPPGDGRRAEAAGHRGLHERSAHGSRDAGFDQHVAEVIGADAAGNGTGRPDAATARRAARAAERPADGSRAICGLAGTAADDRAKHFHRGRAAMGRRRIRAAIEAELAAPEHRRSGAAAAGLHRFHRAIMAEACPRSLRICARARYGETLTPSRWGTWSMSAKKSCGLRRDWWT